MRDINDVAGLKGDIETFAIEQFGYVHLDLVAASGAFDLAKDAHLALLGVAGESAGLRQGLQNRNGVPLAQLDTANLGGLSVDVHRFGASHGDDIVRLQQYVLGRIHILP